MVRRVQANQGGQDYYAPSDNYYGYDQNQQQQDDQNYFSNERSYQPDQSQFQQQYSQPTGNYNYASPTTNSYGQPVSHYGNEAYSANNQFDIGSTMTQPFIQPEKAHISPVIQNDGYGASYGVQSPSMSGSWLSAFGTGGFQGEPPLLEGKKN